MLIAVGFLRKRFPTLTGIADASGVVRRTDGRCDVCYRVLGTWYWAPRAAKFVAIPVPPSRVVEPRAMVPTRVSWTLRKGVRHGHSRAA